MIQSKHRLFDALWEMLHNRFNDPTVEFTKCGTTELRIRVGQDANGPKYYRVKVVEEV